MKTYQVALTVTVPISTVLEIHANNIIEVMDKAIQTICEDPKYCVHDFDGNKQDIVTDDIEVDHVEEIPS